MKGAAVVGIVLLRLVVGVIAWAQTSMDRALRLASAVGLLLFATAPSAVLAATIVIDNGLAPPNPANVIDHAIYAADLVEIRQESVTETPTTVEMTLGGAVDEFAVRDTSFLHVSAGSTNQITNDNVDYGARVTIDAGSVGGFTGAGVLTVNGGTVGPIYGDGLSLALHGGVITSIWSFAPTGGSFQMTDGEVTGDLYGAVDQISGGIIGGNLSIERRGGAIVSGGTFEGDLILYDDATVEMTGGVVKGDARLDTRLPSGSLLLRGGTVEGDVFVANSYPGLTITGGDVLGSVAVGPNGWFAMDAGSIGTDLLLTGYGGFPLTGGTIGGVITVTDPAVLELTAFELFVDGSRVPFAEIAAVSGRLSGVLASGDPMDNDFTRQPVQGSWPTIRLFCAVPGLEIRSTLNLGADEDHYCEDWSGAFQSGNDISRAYLEIADLSFADLSGTNLTDADLSLADLSGADLGGATVIDTDWTYSMYNESTIFPSGNTYDIPPWGLDGGITPWDALMIPVPEPGAGLMLSVGIATLLGLNRRRTHAYLTAQPNHAPHDSLPRGREWDTESAPEQDGGFAI